MLQQIIVAIIVAYAAWSTIRRYFKKSNNSACGGCSGCDSNASKTCATSKPTNTKNTTTSKIICTPQALQQTIRRQKFQ